MSQSSPTPSVRRATPADLQRMVAVDIAGFAAEVDSQFWYRYPPDLRTKYPQDTWNATMEQFTEYLAAEGCETIVAELPSLSDPGKIEIASVAVWGWTDTYTAPQRTPDAASVIRRDMLPERKAAFARVTNAAEKEHFGTGWGHRNLKALSLASDPAYFRRGAATALLHWAMQRAREEGAAIFLTAGSMGEPLYRKLGFKELAFVKIQVEGEEEWTSVLAMVWVSERWKELNAEKAKDL